MTPSLTPKDLTPIYVPLRLAYGLVPIIAGADKFTNLLTNWEKYLPSFAPNILPFSTHTFMLIVGIIEIVAGLAVLTILPRLGAYVVMLWLVLIAINLILAGYFDIAVRDLVMALGAYTLGQVAALYGDKWLPTSASPGVMKNALAH
jgi:hypothetical protein